MRSAWLLLVLALGCAPTIDGPVDQQRTLDAADEVRLAAQLAALPGVVHASATLHRPVEDPFTRRRTAGTAAVVIVVASDRDRAAISRDAAALVTATAPEITEPVVVMDVARPAPAPSRSRELVAVAALLAAIAASAGMLAWRERWRVLSAE